MYGDLPHPDDQNTDLPLFKETTPYAPRSPYSASKAASDHIVRAWHITYGLPILITHCSNNYGPYQFSEKLIPLTILNALENKIIPIYGNGQQIRDWLYIDDHVRALLLAALQGNIGQTFNIGGYAEKKNLEVVTTICDTLEELRPHQSSTYSALITHVDDRLGHDKRYAIDASKIEQHLGWTPIETFESGIRKTVQWYLDNLEWCQQVKNSSYQRELQ